MKLSSLFAESVLLFACVFGKSAHNGRQGRWFGYTYTETKVQKETVTSLLPSSCVHVEATLPPCRSVRNMQPFPEFVGTEIYPEHIKGRQLVQQQNPNDTQQQIVLAPLNNTRSLGWAEYLGLVAPTETVTAVELHTTTILDPGTVVTFSVKGCRPSRLPLDLDRCPSNQYLIEEIVPSATVPHLITPTAAGKINDLNGNELNPKKAKSVEIEPSSPDLIEGDLSIPTEHLSNVQINK